MAGATHSLLSQFGAQLPVRQWVSSGELMSNWEQLAGGSKSVSAGAARASTLPLVKALLDEPAAVGGATLLALVLLDPKRVRAANLLPGLHLGLLTVVVLYVIGVPLAP